MSTNKTPNYQLHSWLGTDDFRFHEVNENFALLDDAAYLILGVYIGPGTSSTLQVNLGFRPRAVLAFRSNGALSSSNTSSESYAVLTFDGDDDCGIVINATGFLVRSTTRSRMALTNEKFNYIALR